MVVVLILLVALLVALLALPSTPFLLRNTKLLFSLLPLLLQTLQTSMRF
jgi:hypothetical protein|tara:strand:- start:249 stop:395 length:147 start_codon:yes stop_codon:yes gene_type:complete